MACAICAISAEHALFLLSNRAVFVKIANTPRLVSQNKQVVKRRTLVRQMCDNGCVLLNSRETKPSRDVKPADGVTLSYQSRIMEAEVLETVPPGAPSKGAAFIRAHHRDPAEA